MSGTSRSKTGNRRVARGNSKVVWPVSGPCLQARLEGLADIDPSFEAAFAIDDLAAFGGLHATTKTALAKLLNSTLTRIIHSSRS